VGAALAATLAVTLAACSGGSSSPAGSPSAPAAIPSGTAPGTYTFGAPASTAPATRWWSDDAATKGSTIDPSRPDAAAAQLHPSQPQYCAVLRQTVQANKSLLAAGSATDPTLRTEGKAFVAEIQRLAPESVAGDWKVLGAALTQFLDSNGKSLGASTATVTQSAKAVIADAKTNCDVTLS